MGEMIRGILFRPLEMVAEITDMEEDIPMMQEMLGTEVVDMVMVTVEGHDLVFVVDDNGLLAKNPKPVAVINSKGDVALVGDMLIFGHDEDCEYLRSLTDEEIDAVFDSLRTCLVNCERDGTNYRYNALVMFTADPVYEQKVPMTHRDFVMRTR